MDDAPTAGVERVNELMRDGIEYQLARRLDEAVDRYERVVAIRPNHGEAWRLLGIVALQMGRNEDACVLLERALRIDAGDAAAHASLGAAYELQGAYEPALAEYAAACAIDAEQGAAIEGYARVALVLRRFDEAIAGIEAASARGAVGPGALRALGAARLALRDYAGAERALLASLELERHPDAYANLGATYVHRERARDAAAVCADALALAPRHAFALNNLGVAHKALGDLPAALAAFERAAALELDEGHANLGATRLLVGDYRGGWPEYGRPGPERRANPLSNALPMWDGTPAPGLRLLVWPEQGTGDTIQMVRFLPQARARVASLTLACPPGTRALLGTARGADALVETSEVHAGAGFDMWLPTVRLPVVFDVRPASIPDAPYLHADGQRVEHFRRRLGGERTLRVGLVWGGSPDHEWDALRSCPLRDLEPLAEVSGVTWFALQKGTPCAQQEHSPLPLVAINAEISDFADTAAIVAQLDLVITVDTSVAHLAGALGRPAWVMLSNRPDWRWQRGGPATPWYPTLRLFRQGEDGAWAPVVTQVATALRALVDASPGAQL